MKILAIDTSCDETSCAVVEGRRVLSSVVYSQAVLHKKWGGVLPSLARRAHAERIDWVVEKALKNAGINETEVDIFAVTKGPGLAIALEVGIEKAKQLAAKNGKPLVAVNHMEGHIYSNFVQNSKGNPIREMQFPYLVLLISGAHTELVIFKDNIEYEVIGRTVDDAAGEALDKAGRLLGFGYPGGPGIEQLASEVNNEDTFKFPRPLIHRDTLNFSYSGLKTSFLYKVKEFTEEEKLKQLKQLASSFQEAVFDTLISKTKKASKLTGINRIILGGGVSVNKRLRNKFRSEAKQNNWQVYFPPYKYLNFDNAAMIGVAAYYKAQKKQFVAKDDPVDRIPRLSLPAFITYKSDMKFSKVRPE